MKPRKPAAAPHAGRLTRPPLAHLHGIKDEVVAETAAHLHAFDTAHMVMLVECGIVARQPGARILEALRAAEPSRLVELRQAAGGGIHAGERFLAARLGPAIAANLGLARSSGDLSAVAMRLHARQSAEHLARLVNGFRAALLAFAEAERETVMPGTTHGQHAQPTTLGHWAMMVEAALARDQERLLAFRVRANRSPAGAGIMTGSDFPIDRARVARLLGFDAVMVNTMDAILSHDLEIDFATTILQLAHLLARFADDLMLWSTFEYAMIELPDWFCGTSSMMPQKKNPDGLEDIKGIAAAATGLVVSIAGTERGPTGLPIIERRRSDRALRQVVTDLAGRLAMLPALLSEMVVKRDRLRDLAGANWAQATDLAALAVRHGGIDWRSAHELVGAFVRHCLGAGVKPAQASAALFDEVATRGGGVALNLPERDFSKSLDPSAFVARRGLVGGPAPAALRRAILQARRRLIREEKTLAALEAHNEAAQAELARAVAAIVGGES